MTETPGFPPRANADAGPVDTEGGLTGLLARLEYEPPNEQPSGARGGPEAVAGSMDLEPLTPELVLVDPELAGRVRKELSDNEDNLANLSPGPRRPASASPAPPTVRPTRPPWPPADGPEVAVPVVSTTDVGRQAVSTPPASDVLPDLPRRRRRTLRVIGVLVILGSAAALVAIHPWSDRSPPRRSAQVRTGATQTRTQSEPRRQEGGVVATRTFAWVRVPNATYYFVQLHRGRRQIFEARPSRPRFVFPSRWTFEGRRYRLTAGRYRWSVRPGFGRPSTGRHGREIVRATLIVQRRSD